ncbi:hypothetical protein MHH70_09455 [Metasolibacillus sp. FSL H7-0170]|uniref:hypothetical protein n=1 Tax=Metasolibacillus sp. FSL H7-0170 TaxID=2921431 RepID=UPI0031589D70
MINMQKSSSVKVALDMFLTQMTWASGYLFVMLLIFSVRAVASFIGNMEANNFITKMIKTLANEGGMDSFSTLIFYSSNIFMFVIGIIAAYGFLQYFVSNGVTRKNYFIGAAIGSFGVAVVIPIIIKIILMIEVVVTKILPLQFADSTKIMKADDEIIGQVIQNILFSPFIDMTNGGISAMVIFALNIFCYYVAGWFISVSFYRLGTTLGLLSIPLVIVLFLLYDELMSIALGLPVANLLPSIDTIPSVLAFALAIAIVVAMLVMIRLFTKKVAVKL